MKNPNSKVFAILFGSVNIAGTVVNGGLFPVHEDKAAIKGELVPLSMIQYMAAFVDKNFQDYHLLNGILVPVGTSLIGATVTNQVTGTDASFYAAALAAYETRANSMKTLVDNAVTYISSDLIGYANELGVASVIEGDYAIDFDVTEMTDQLMGFLATHYFYTLSKSVGQNAAGITAPVSGSPMKFHALIVDVFQKTNRVEVFKKIYVDTYTILDNMPNSGLLLTSLAETFDYTVSGVELNGSSATLADYTFKYTVSNESLFSIAATIISVEAGAGTVGSGTLTVEMFAADDVDQLTVLATKVIPVYVNTNVYVLTFADSTLDILIGSGATSMGITFTINGNPASPAVLSSLEYAESVSDIVSTNTANRTITPVAVGSTDITVSLVHPETGNDLVTNDLTVTVS